MIIGISGKIKTGKDTVGQIIQYLTSNEYQNDNSYSYASFLVDRKTNYEIKKFADKLKDIVCLLIGCTREQLEDRGFKEKELGEEWWQYGLIRKNCRKPIFYPSKKEIIEKQLKLFKGSKMYINKLTPRKILQLLGTECGREIIHPNIWCNSLMSEYKGDIEEWKGIEGYEGVYQVSSFGRVESLDREIVYGDRIRGEYHSRKGVILKPTLSNGYPTVSLSGKTHTVHSLVAKTFIENLNDNDLVVNHIDYNKENNFYKNLEYISQGDNVRHNYVAGKANIGENQKDAKLDVDKVIAIRKLLEEGTLSQNRIAKLFEISPTTITDIKKGRKWKHVGKQVKEVEPILPVNMPNWIITDVRFPNEAQAIKDRGGVLIRVNRPLSLLYPKQWDRFIKYTSDKDGSFKQDEDEFKDYLLTGNKEEEALYYKLKHYSETALDNYKDWDYVIDNDGSITELIEKVKQVVCK